MLLISKAIKADHTFLGETYLQAEWATRSEKQPSDMNNRPKAVAGIFVVFLPFFLLLFSYTLVVASSPLTVEQQDVFQFLDGKQELSAKYTAEEVSHLRDVIRVMKQVNFTFYVLGIMMVILVAYSWEKKDLLQNMLRYGGIATAVFLLLLLLFTVIDFNGLFTLFHQLFFPQGNWQFPADSLLIRTFPVDFFVSLGRRIFVLTLLGGLFNMGLGYLLKKKMKEKN